MLASLSTMLKRKTKFSSLLVPSTLLRFFFWGGGGEGGGGRCRSSTKSIENGIVYRRKRQTTRWRFWPITRYFKCVFSLHCPLAVNVANIFVHTSVLVSFSPVHTKTFANDENVLGPWVVLVLMLGFGLKPMLCIATYVIVVKSHVFHLFTIKNVFESLRFHRRFQPFIYRL